MQSKTVKNHEEEGKGFYLAQFKTGELAIFSYYLESDKQVILIDPTYDVYPYKQLAETRGSKIVAIMMTHYHADFLSGHTEFELPIIMGPGSAKEASKFKVTEYKDGYKLTHGCFSLKFLHTPGHTLESTCYRLFDENGKEFAVFTGDTMFLGQVGRPDLAVNDGTTKEQLAKKLYHSLQKIKHEVDHEARIYPAHGAGSSCGKSIGQGNYCHLKTQMEKNYALKINGEQQFVHKILDGMGAEPKYYSHDAKQNQQGNPDFEQAFKKAMVPLTIEQFQDQMKKGSVSIDCRPDFEGGVIEGSYAMTEKGTVATWVGSIFSPETSFVVFAAPEKGGDSIQRFIRIGFFNIKGYNNFSIEDWKAKGLPTFDIKQVDAKQFAQIKDANVLDVRKPEEWESKGVVQNAKLIPFSVLPKKWEQLKGVDNIYVHCASGMRARLASSILKMNGIDSVVIFDKFENVKNLVKTVPYKQ